MSHTLKLEPYKDYDQLYQIIDKLDSLYKDDLNVHHAVSLCLQHFPEWAIVDMVVTPYAGTDWEEASLFSSLLKIEAAKLYPSNKVFA